jgi:hypothetical protein
MRRRPCDSKVVCCVHRRAGILRRVRRPQPRPSVVRVATAVERGSFAVRAGRRGPAPSQLVPGGERETGTQGG